MTYRCKCGQETSEGPPPACARCWICRTNLALSPELVREPIPHLWCKHETKNHTIVSQCAFCGKTTP